EGCVPVRAGGRRRRVAAAPAVGGADRGSATDGPLGMFSAMYVFDMRACELAGKMKPRGALGQVTNAAKLPALEARGPVGSRLVRIDPAEQADEGGPAARLMRKFGEVARLAARQHNTGQRCDPGQLHSVGFG